MCNVLCITDSTDLCFYIRQRGHTWDAGYLIANVHYKRRPLRATVLGAPAITREIILVRHSSTSQEEYVSRL